MSYESPVAGGGLTNINVSAGTTSNNMSALTFANGNGVSWGLNGSVVTATVATDYLTTAMASNRGTDFVQATAAFAGTNCSGTIASGGISVNAKAFSGGVSNLGNTGGDTGVTGTRLVFRGSNNVTLSQSTDANGATIGFNAPAGGAGNTLSYFRNFDVLDATQSQTISGASHHVQPFALPYAASFGYICYPVSRSIVSTTAAPASSAATRAGTMGEYETHNVVLYSRGVGASSFSLQSVGSTSVGSTRQIEWSIGANNSSTQMSSIYRMSWCQYGADVNTAFSTSESTNSYRLHSSHYSNFAGLKMDCIMFPTSLSAGQYWLAYCYSRSIAGTNTSGNQTNGSMTHSRHVLSNVNNAYNMMGSTTNSSNQFMHGLGIWSTDSTARTTASIALSQISSTASILYWPLQFVRIA